jgi:(p)ppGpp synthase/HD superfamily hydrolase
MLSEVETRHRKQLAVMRGWLEGRRFYAAMDALEMVRLLEQGPRKDGCTPKFHHQLSIARLLTTLEPHFLFPEETITAGFLHDILEDHADQWTREALVDRYGKRIGDAVWLLTKKSAGMVKNYDAYFAEMSACPVASLVKLADRAHNLQTMQGVFSFDKQAAYISEVDTWFFPMLKTARRRFPKQYPAYENLKITLRNQTRLIRHIHAAAREARMQI